MAIIPPQRKSISQVKAQLLNPATTSHFQVSVSFQNSRFNRFKSELGLNLDQGRLNILCSDAALPGSRLVGRRNPLKGKRRREIVHAGQVHDTTVPHPNNHPEKVVGIDGREKRLFGGRKTRKHRRKHKRKTRKHKRKHKTKKRKHHRRKHKRKTRRR